MPTGRPNPPSRTPTALTTAPAPQVAPAETEEIGRDSCIRPTLAHRPDHSAVARPRRRAAHRARRGGASPGREPDRSSGSGGSVATEQDQGGTDSRNGGKALAAPGEPVGIDRGLPPEVAVANLEDTDGACTQAETGPEAVASFFSGAGAFATSSAGTAGDAGNWDDGHPADRVRVSEHTRTERASRVPRRSSSTANSV